MNRLIISSGFHAPQTKHMISVEKKAGNFDRCDNEEKKEPKCDFTNKQIILSALQPERLWSRFNGNHQGKLEYKKVKEF